MMLSARRRRYGLPASHPRPTDRLRDLKPRLVLESRARVRTSRDARATGEGWHARERLCYNIRMWLAGVDEAGRGPIAGPVVAACVVLPPRHPIQGIADSKRLSPAQRERLFTQIRREAVAWAIGFASPREIERLNIVQASLLAMRRAVLQLPVTPQRVLIDGKFCIPHLSLPQQAVVGGDATEECIAAASILAKVARDRLMQELDRLYPQYGFGQHKGYPTPLHLERLLRYGACPAHRRTYAPVVQRTLLTTCVEVET